MCTETYRPATPEDQKLIDQTEALFDAAAAYRRGFRLRYCGRSWLGPEWCIERRFLGLFWVAHNYVYGDEAAANTELRRFANNPR